jgi:hypothetical protein
MAEGSLNTTQAHTLVRSLQDLPTGLDPHVRVQAEARLVSEAARFGPRQLRILGRRVLDAIAPQVGESHEHRALEREEAHAARSTNLHTRDNGDGTSELRIRVPTTTCDRLLTYLHAFSSPRRCPEDKRPYDERLGTAFASFLENIDPTRLPQHGGDATTILITVDHQMLATGLAPP